MQMQAARDLNALVDGMRPNPLMRRVWALCFLVLFLDGYDVTVIAFVAPHLVRELAFEQASLGMLFSASLVGMAIGGALGGLAADRRGRRFTVVAGCLVFGLATLSMLLTTTATAMALCRLCVGVGMGAALATAIALAAEFAPGPIRGRVVALVGMATPLGSVMPGLLTATLPSHADWRVLLVIGGVLPVMLALVLMFGLPESIKYLARQPARQAELARMLERLAPGRTWTAMPPEAVPINQPVSWRRLFEHGLGPLTLLVWVALFAGSMALYLINNWMPFVLENVGLSTRQTGAMSALFATSGLLGIIGVAALVGRIGVVLLPGMFAVSVPFLLWTVTFDSPQAAFFLCLLVPGIAMGAVLVLCNVIPGLVYPTEIRATGVGFVVAAGRLGAIAGPLVGGTVLSLQLPPQHIFAVAAMPMVLGAIAAIALAVICHRRFGGFQLREAGTSKSPLPLAPRPRPDLQNHLPS